ncbi:MAG: hypothetical protein J6B16_03720 [Clostridia bacterium]|nr:hypothetical protein [Clostridia bacterium]
MKKIIVAFLFMLISVIAPFQGIVFASAQENDSYKDSKSYSVKPKVEDTDYNWTHEDSYDTFMEAYFRNLNSNMGYNLYGSCSYVALGMMLSYYDTYLNDGIISENYDAVSNYSKICFVSNNESPGIIDETTIIIGQDYTFQLDEYYNPVMCEETYLEYINYAKDKSLHAKLIDIGIQKGYVDINTTGFLCGLSHDGAIDVLNQYLSNFTFLQNKYQIIEYNNTYNSVEDFVIEKIDLGYPVFVSIYDSTGQNESHSVVAYDYKYINGELQIYCNMGYGSHKYAYYPIFLNYTNCTDAFIIDFDLEHTHSNNYALRIGSKTTYYCYCDENIETYKSLHVGAYNYVYKDTIYHNTYYNCGHVLQEKHLFVIYPEDWAMYSTGFGVFSLRDEMLCACGVSRREIANM